MSIKTRRILFYFLTGFFVVAGTLVILYSRGIRFDPENLDFVKTGGIYVSSQPNRASIFLDGEEQRNKSGLLQRGTLLTNLIPDTYEIAIRQDGYRDWRKNVEVKPGEVAVFDTVVLPADIAPGAIKYGQFDNFGAAPGYLALEGGGGVTLNGAEVFGHHIIALTESGSLLTQSKNTGNYYLTNEFNAENGLNLTLIFNNLKEDRLGLPGFVQLREAAFIPDSERQFYVATENALYFLDTANLDLQLITSDYDAADYQSDGTLVWTTNDSLYRFNPVLRNQAEPLSLAEANLANKHFIRIQRNNGGWLLLDADGNLTYLERESRLIAENVSDFSVDPDGKRIAVLDNLQNLWVQDLNTGEQFTGLGQGVSQFFWYEDSAHLVVLEQNDVYFRDISMGAPVSSHRLADNVLRCTYNTAEKEIVFLNHDGVWSTRL